MPNVRVTIEGSASSGLEKNRGSDVAATGTAGRDAGLAGSAVGTHRF